MFWSAAAALAPGIIDAGLGMISANQQNKANVGLMREQQRFQSAEADKQMRFQESMSSSAHQREVADLRAAGLNPILSAGGGASSPSGAMAGSPSTPSNVPGIQPFLQKGVSAALDLKRVNQEIDESASRVKNQTEEAETQRRMQRKLDADTGLIQAQARGVEAQNVQKENRAAIERSGGKFLGIVDAVTDRIPLGSVLSGAAGAGIVNKLMRRKVPFNLRNPKMNAPINSFDAWAKQEKKGFKNWRKED